MIIEYVFLALIKIIDNILSTIKSICVYREQKILSSVLVVISQLIFFLVVSEVVEDNTLLVIVIVAVSSGLGNWLAFPINNKFKRADKWTMILTSRDKDDVIKLCQYLTIYNIKHIANRGITRGGEDTIHIIAFSKTKEESRLIENYLKSTDSKYLKEII